MKKLGMFMLLGAVLSVGPLSADFLDWVKLGDMKLVKTYFLSEDTPYLDELAQSYVYAFHHDLQFLKELQDFYAESNCLAALLEKLHDEEALKHLCKTHAFTQDQLDEALTEVFSYSSDESLKNRLQIGQILMDAGANPFRSKPTIFENAWTNAFANWEADALKLFMKQPSFDKDWARAWYLNSVIYYAYAREISPQSMEDDHDKLFKFVHQFAQDHGWILADEESKEWILANKIEFSYLFVLTRSLPWKFSGKFRSNALMDYILRSEDDEVFSYKGSLSRVDKRIKALNYNPKIVAKRIQDEFCVPKTITYTEDGDTYYNVGPLIPIHFYATLIQDERVEDLLPKEIVEKILKIDTLFMQLYTPSGELVSDWVHQRIEAYLVEAK